MVRAHRYPCDLRAVFSRARPAPCAGADDDARGRGRDAGVVHEIDAPRGSTCLYLRLPAYAKEEVAADFRAHVARRDAEHLPATPVQSRLRRAPGRLVCAEPPGRRFRGDLRNLAYAGARLARALCGLEGAAKARLRR